MLKKYLSILITLIIIIFLLIVIYVFINNPKNIFNGEYVFSDIAFYNDVSIVPVYYGLSSRNFKIIIKEDKAVVVDDIDDSFISRKFEENDFWQQTESFVDVYSPAQYEIIPLDDESKYLEKTNSNFIVSLKSQRKDLAVIKNSYVLIVNSGSVNEKNDDFNGFNKNDRLKKLMIYYINGEYYTDYYSYNTGVMLKKVK